MKDHGAAISARIGLNTWAAFYGTQEDAVVAGDIAMLETELTATLKLLTNWLWIPIILAYDIAQGQAIRDSLTKAKEADSFSS